MQQYSDFEKRQAALLKQKQEIDLEAIRCPRCDSQWFEQVKFSRFKVDHHIILGQDIPVRPGNVPYTLLKCVRCGDLLEPRVQHNSRDIASGDYDHFLDTIDGKYDTRPKEEQEKEETSNAFQAEEL